MGPAVRGDFTCLTGGLKMRFVLTKGSKPASKLFRANHCELNGQAIRYKVMKLSNPVSGYRSEAGEPHGRSTR
jgi:hypothetical protein